MPNRSLTAALAAILILATAALTPVRAQTRPAPADPLAAFAASLTDLPAGALANRGAFYVPAYSSIRAGSGRTKLDFAVTLSIHNTSDTTPLVIDRIDYFGTSGALVQSYLSKPVALKPFGTIEVFIPADDVRGGTGANFIVGWAAAGAIAEPIVETFMVASSGTNSFSAISAGRPIRLGGGRP
jgi:Protein of unknown function (DUF3124)